MKKKEATFSFPKVAVFKKSVLDYLLKHERIVRHVYKKILSKSEKFENGQEFWKKAKRVLKICFLCIFVFVIYFVHFYSKNFLTINIFIFFKIVTNT